MAYVILFTPWLLVFLFHLWLRHLQQISFEAGKIPARGSTIPGTRQKFLWIQDWSTMTWGDLVGLAPALCVGLFLGGAYLPSLPNWQWVVVATTLVGVITGWEFHRMCLRPNHKPDYGFPRPGEASSMGVAHSVFFGLSAGIILVTIYTFWQYPEKMDDLVPAWLLWGMFLGGLAVLGAATIVDLVKGRFAPLMLDPDVSDDGSMLLDLRRDEKR